MQMLGNYRHQGAYKIKCMSLANDHYLDMNVKLYQHCSPSNNASHYATELFVLITFTINPTQMHAQQANYDLPQNEGIKASNFFLKTLWKPQNAITGMLGYMDPVP